MCIVLQSEGRSKCIDQTWYLQRSLVQQCLQHHQAAQMAWWGFWEPPHGVAVFHLKGWQTKSNMTKMSIAIYLKIPSSAFKALDLLLDVQIYVDKQCVAVRLSASQTLGQRPVEISFAATSNFPYPYLSHKVFMVHYTLHTFLFNWGLIPLSYFHHIFSRFEVHCQSTQKSTKWLLHMSHLRLLIVLLAQQPQPVAALGKVRQFWVWCLLWCHLRSHQLFIYIIDLKQKNSSQFNFVGNSGIGNSWICLMELDWHRQAKS